MQEGIKKAKWDYTREFKRQAPDLYNQRYSIDPKSGESLYQGRPLITRDSPINGGVYLVLNNSEALVVDDSKDGHLDKAYTDFIKERKRLTSNQHFKDGLLEAVLKYAQKKIPYSQKIADQIDKEYGAGRKINISMYFEGGVCRHQAVFAGYLLERMKKEGYVNGRASIDRNYVDGIGGHAWVRYVNSRGEVIIIDPANLYIGNLTDIIKDRWFYERPEDLNLGENSNPQGLLDKIKARFKGN